jgi:hypothetical protein
MRFDYVYYKVNKNVIYNYHKDKIQNYKSNINLKILLNL